MICFRNLNAVITVQIVCLVMSTSAVYQSFNFFSQSDNCQPCGSKNCDRKCCSTSNSNCHTSSPNDQLSGSSLKSSHHPGNCCPKSQNKPMCNDVKHFSINLTIYNLETNYCAKEQEDEECDDETGSIGSEAKIGTAPVPPPAVSTKPPPPPPIKKPPTFIPNYILKNRDIHG